MKKKKKILGWGYKSSSESWRTAVEAHDVVGVNLTKTRKQTLKLIEQDRENKFIGPRTKAVPFCVVIELEES